MNIIAARVLVRNSAHSLNARGAYLHIVGDLLATVGTLAAAVAIRYTGWLIADPIASILTTDPQPLTVSDPLAPAEFDRLVRTCLQKDADARFQNAHDVALQLRWVQESGAQAPPDVQQHHRSVQWIVLAISIVWTAEALNTAFEFLADAASPEFHPLVRDAKDVAAGAVLITALAAAVIGAIVCWPYLRKFAE